MPLRLSVVTAERTLLEQDNVQRLIVPSTEGQLTILPLHAALMASLDIGEMVAVVNGQPEVLAVHGGFIQVLHDRVTVLADAAERVEDIDEARADAARQRAEQRLQRSGPPGEALDLIRAQLALRRALLRQRVARRRRATAASGAPSRAG